VKEEYKKYLENNVINEDNAVDIIDAQQEEIERLKIIEEKYKDSQLYIKDFKDEIERLNNIINEVRESANRELKIAEENIKQSEKWLDIEEEQGHAKRDIHTGKVVKRYMKMFLDILDKGE